MSASMPGHQNVRPDPQDEEAAQWCRRHRREYFDECEMCVDRSIALAQLEIQINRVSRSNTFDLRDMKEALSRARRVIREQC